ncbi:MAG: hypothetical protein DWQ34_05260 [Planctomycetota bacterium]|nr:MAG: hypothetical protein DWQ29_15955 [Planctomycetota bacterium]REJ95851.1 MAG: hypothetical protein DWQ34_05260 [Planctomycetota bacterium]REK25659.1 MAG: hypothetical protein DWQ41_11425 [Planctomycetota bacterium]REK31758.1 MAG: hypothetical protein DWQ45_19260 [Planctomycetota bacterium]
MHSIPARTHSATCWRWLGCLTLLVAARTAQAQLNFESEPINYETAPTTNRVASLQQAIDDGAATLEWDEEHGYLRSVLEHLDVPVSSQMLVFSKTSFQQRRITSRRPRAIYFNDDVYVGWVQRGDVVEVSTVDNNLGGVFYTLNQEETETPRFVRDRGQCLTCHASSRTAGVPGHLVRSVYADRSGQPFFGSGTFTTDHRSPFKERWGGWYVTGSHGKQRHMGNVALDRSDAPEAMDREAGANISDLSELLDVSPYLARSSDIVALMLLEHQTQAQNLITRAAFETRSALHYDQIMNDALDRPADFRSESATRRIESAVDKLVDYLLFVDEFTLEDGVEGNSAFTDEFTAQGPFDRRGRSLRQVDLNQRLMKYPCSYLIYSAQFRSLPEPALEYAYRRLFSILSGSESDERYAHLTQVDRESVLEILNETHPQLLDWWKDSQVDP